MPRPPTHRSTAPDPILSVIVVTYNNPAELEACLSSLEHAAPRGGLQTIVVDNASGAQTQHILRNRFPDVLHVCNEENLGFTRANNQGIRHAKGRYILLLNDDTVVPMPSLQGLIDFMEANPRAGICGPQMRYPNNEFQVSCNAFPSLRILLLQMLFVSRIFPDIPLLAPHRFHLPPTDRNRVRRVDWLSGACLLARREMLEDIGVLDEGFFMYFEETDLCRRATRSRWEVWYVPTVHVIHVASSSAKRVPAFCLRHSLSSLLHYTAKHFPAPQRRCVEALMGIHLMIRFVLLAADLLVEGPRGDHRERADSLFQVFARLARTVRAKRSTHPEEGRCAPLAAARADRATS